MTELKRRIYSVSEFSGELSHEIAERFPSVCVRGEVTNLSKPRSGHWYFALKDETSQLRLVMFRSSNLRAPQIKDGDEIIACGKPGIYRERGDLQLLVTHIQAAGEGELQRRFELLKRELQDAGYFDPALKQPIPAYPRKVAIVTSSSGAVIHDIQIVTSRRAPALPLLLVPSEVQGEKAIASLQYALALADRRADIDLIILARGGGSLEDFAAFNSREIAEAVRACKTPVISSVGHESDISIADLVADRRAATPSEAAEIASAGWYSAPTLLQQQEQRLAKSSQRLLDRHRSQLAVVAGRLRSPSERLQAAAQKLDSLEPLLGARILAQLNRRTRMLESLERHLDPLDFCQRISHQRRDVQQLAARLERGQKACMRHIQERFHAGVKLLSSVNPLGTLTRGYSLALDADGKLVSSVAQVSKGDPLVTRLRDGLIHSRIDAVESKALGLEGPDLGHQDNGDQPQDQG